MVKTTQEHRLQNLGIIAIVAISMWTAMTMIDMHKSMIEMNKFMVDRENLPKETKEFSVAQDQKHITEEMTWRASVTERLDDIDETIKSLHPEQR